MKAFFKTPILQHFHWECHIWIETDALIYAIGRVLSQLTLDHLGQWHLVAYFLHKIILVETRYKTCDGKILAIIKVF